MVILFGLKNCDTCRKARKWMDAEGIDHRFVDLREQGVDADVIDRWIDGLGCSVLLNRRSTTWRNLPEAERDNIGPEEERALMMAHPTLIKRPVWDVGGRLFLGFNDQTKEQIVRQADRGRA